MARVLFPAFLDLVGRRVLVVGGGTIAAAKVTALLDAGARVVVVAPDIHPELETLPIERHRRPFAPSDLADCWYVVSAAPPDINAQVAREAVQRRVFVNAVDDPRHASAFAGSVLRRGPVTVAVSTGGEAPALARVLREALERLIGHDVEEWAELAVRLRRAWRHEGKPMAERRNALLAALAELHAETRRASPVPAEDESQSAHARKDRARGFVSLVGAGPGDPELVTRRASRLLAESDLVLYDALVSSATVALAKRAQKVFVGRRRGVEAMSQEAIIRTMIRAAQRGRRVVRLKGGDPFVFGRGGEEALALAAARIAYEVVPGVSAALAAPAAASIPVTHRGISSAVLITTGHDVERFSDLVSSLPPCGTTLVVLMGTSRKAEISAALIDAGWRASIPAAIVWEASLPHQSVWSGPLSDLSEASADATVTDGDPPAGTIIVGDVVAIRDVYARASTSWTSREEACNG